MPVRYLMLGVFGFIIAAILSIVVVQNLQGGSGDQTTTPPQPVTTTPGNAVRDTQ
jgi:hypothetical protein